MKQHLRAQVTTWVNDTADYQEYVTTTSVQPITPTATQQMQRYHEMT